MDNVGLFFLIFNLSNQSPILDSIMIFITKYLIYLAFLFMLIISIKNKTNDKKAFILAIITLPIAILLIKIVHIFFVEQRPFITYNLIPLTDNFTDLSFPSRHATIIAVLAFSYMYFKSKWSVLLLTSTTLIGLSRIYIGVHYPLDVLGGFVLGAVSLIITIKLVKLLRISFFR